MKSLLTTVFLAAALVFAAPVLAGPNVTDRSHDQRAMQHAAERRELMTRYALTGDRAEVTAYRLERRYHWVGARQRHVTYERVPVR